MSRTITLDEALALLHVEPAIPESDDERERVPHARSQGEPCALEDVRHALTVCVSSTPPRLCVMAGPAGARMVMGVGQNRVYCFDARPFTEAELVAGVFALLSPDRARAVDPTVLDGNVANVLSIGAESHRGGWTISAWRLADGCLTERLWGAKGATFAEAADNLRASLSAQYGVPND